MAEKKLKKMKKALDRLGNDDYIVCRKGKRINKLTSL